MFLLFLLSNMKYILIQKATASKRDVKCVALKGLNHKHRHLACIELYNRLSTTYKGTAS
jgi:hypothetical protein